MKVAIGVVLWCMHVMLARGMKHTNFFKENFARYGSDVFFDTGSFGYMLEGREYACKRVEAPAPKFIDLVRSVRTDGHNTANNLTAVYIYFNSGAPNFVHEISYCQSVAGNLFLANASWAGQIQALQFWNYQDALAEIKQVLNNDILLDDILSMLHTCPDGRHG